MSTVRDAIVVGLGAAGSATLWQLARRGVRSVGIDRFSPPHDRGSSHGDTRITRLAIGEGAACVPLVRRSHEIWRALEAQGDRDLLRQVGGLIYGSTASRATSHGAEDFLESTIAVARANGIAHEVLDAAAMRPRFPQFRFRGDERGYFEPGAGFVRPEACIAAQLEEARRAGAVVRTGEQVLSWGGDARGVHVVTNGGRYEAGAVVLCAGAWVASLVPEMAAHTRTYRQVLYWFATQGPPGPFAPGIMPVFIRVPDAGTAMFYGFPAVDGASGGIKLAGEQMEHDLPPDEMAVQVHPGEVSAMHALASPHLPIGRECLRAVTCKYTVTPDFGFVIDRHPGVPGAWIASACSGHGFKHSAAIGEALAEQVAEGRSALDLSPFALARFATRGG